MKRIPLRCTDRQYRNQMFYLELADDTATFKDEQGKAIDAFTLDEAVENIEPPGITTSITQLTIDSKLGVLHFNSRPEDMERLRRFLEQAVTQKGPKVIRNYRLVMIAGIVVGLLIGLVGLYATAWSLNNAVNKPRGEYTIYYGPVVIGLLIIGQCGYLLARSLAMTPGGAKDEDDHDDGRKVVRPQIITAGILGGACVIGIAAYSAFAAMTALPTTPAPVVADPPSGDLKPAPPPQPVAKGVTEHPALPVGFACDSELFAVRGGVAVPEGRYIRSRDAGYLNKDFDLDVVFELNDDTKAMFIGLGPAPTPDQAEPAFSSVARIHPLNTSNGDIIIATGTESHRLHSLSSRGPHCMRLAKRGKQITWSLHQHYKEGDPFSHQHYWTTVDVPQFQPALTAENSRLYYGNNCIIHKATLTPVVLPGRDIPPHAALPAGFKADTEIKILGDAAVQTAHYGYIRTVENNLLQKDFDLDVVYQMEKDTKTIYIGMGWNRTFRGDPLGSAIALRAFPPTVADGYHSFGTNSSNNNVTLARIKSYGKHMARLSKRGMTLTCSIDQDFDGTFKPDFTTTIENINTRLPNFRNDNTHLFYGSGTFHSVRLTIIPK